MIPRQIFTHIFEMGYDYAKYNREARFLASDNIEPFSDTDLREQWEVFQQDYDDLLTDEGWNRHRTEVEVDISGLDPFDEGTLTFDSMIEKNGPANFTAHVEPVRFEAVADPPGVFELTLAADFEGDDS